MNPYLEHRRVFHDFHQSFIVTARRHLQRQVRAPYTVQVDYDVYLDEPGSDLQLTYRPDVWISTSEPRQPAPATPTLIAPALGELELPAISETKSNYLRVVNLDSDAVVCVIEVLSPTNKTNKTHRSAYLRKRNTILCSETHFVELDLLRAGPRLPVKGLPVCDYYAMVSRASRRPAVELWPCGLREPLPTIPIPLAGHDADVTMDVQRVLHETYDESGYERFIYRSEPEPPLPADDQLWADLLRPR
jgi:hypothetical protein